jgi:hypothetical protein
MEEIDTTTTFCSFDENFNSETFKELTKLTEPYIEIINPQGCTIVRTNSELVFDWFRLHIKKNKLEGYKIKTTDNKIYQIFQDGTYNTIDNVLEEYPGSVHLDIIFGLI